MLERARDERLLVLGIFLLALVPRLCGLGHGSPHHEYVPDNHVVRAALGMLAERDPVPPPGRYTSYPYLVPYLLAPIYAGKYVWMRASGAVNSEEEFATLALENPFPFFVLARGLVALFGALSAVWCYRLARRLEASTCGAALAAGLVAAGLLHLQFSLQARPWVPMGFFLLLACERAAHLLRGGPLHAAIVCAVAAGAAAACHPVGFLAYLPLLAVAGALAVRRPRWLIGCLAAVLGTTILGYPWLVLGVAPEGLQVYASAPLRLGGQGLFLRFDGSRAPGLALALLLHEPVLWGLLVLALLSRLRRGAASHSPRGLRAARWMVAVVALIDLFCFGAYFGSFPRYFLPALVLLPAVAAAHWQAVAWERWAVALAVLAAVVTAARLVVVLNREDTRHLAAAALVGERDRIAIEAHGPPLPLSREALEGLRVRVPGGLTRRERHRLEVVAAGEGFDTLPLERIFTDHTLTEWRPGYAHFWSGQGWPNPGSIPSNPTWSRLFWTLSYEGVHSVLRVRPEPGQRSADLDALIDWCGEKVLEFTPGADDAGLPGELRSGWIGLWQLQRPGPRIEWYRLPRRDHSR